MTGSAGYVGQPLVAALARRGHAVLGVDIVAAPHTVVADVRALPDRLLDGADAVVHLAAISFAPEWDDVSDLIQEVNVDATERVLAQCEAAGVPRVVIASSASIFEGCIDPLAAVGTAPQPRSEYARSKVECERALAASRIACRIAVRKGTVCGFGPAPRLDLLTNAMSIAALRSRRVFVDGDGTSSRPVLRLVRAVRGYVQAATAPLPHGMHRVNLCDDNVDVLEVATEIARLTGATVERREPRGLARSYRVLDGATERYDVIDLPRASAKAIIAGVLDDARRRIHTLPVVSLDPREDRLAMLRAAAAGAPR